jgi:N-acetylmuramoyl-L-alanine amidase
MNQRSHFPLAPLFLILLLSLTACESLSVSRVRRTSRTFTTVVLDPGHGGHDNGATRRGLMEKNLTLDVVRRLDGKLHDNGFRTVVTRRSDVFIPLDDRARISNRQENAIFVSIHFNDSTNRKANGFETYYHDSEARQIARNIESSLVKGCGFADRGVKTARFRVLVKNENPAVLVECGFLSNAKENATIAKPETRERIANAVLNGILRQRGGPLHPQMSVPSNGAE